MISSWFRQMVRPILLQALLPACPGKAEVRFYSAPVLPRQAFFFKKKDNCELFSLNCLWLLRDASISGTLRISLSIEKIKMPNAAAILLSSTYKLFSKEVGCWPPHGNKCRASREMAKSRKGKDTWQQHLRPSKLCSQSSSPCTVIEFSHCLCQRLRFRRTTYTSILHSSEISGFICTPPSPISSIFFSSI